MSNELPMNEKNGNGHTLADLLVSAKQTLGAGWTEKAIRSVAQDAWFFDMGIAQAAAQFNKAKLGLI